jgi:putative spermidine/putrescine transport system permease protein
MVSNEKTVGSRLWIFAVWATTIFFIVNLFGIIGAVVTSSFATRWLRSWFPDGFTTKWYFSAWAEFQLGDVLLVTFQIVFAVVFLSGLIGVPAAYAMARRNFPGKQIVLLLLLLPLLVPPVTFGIPLATVLYKSGLGGTMFGVILANLVPTVPFVILVMIPFIEQIDPRVEAAARVFGAVVALYYAVFAAGVRAVQSIDAMAVVYMATTLIWLVIALRFVNPTQMVTRAKQHPAH